MFAQTITRYEQATRSLFILNENKRFQGILETEYLSALPRFSDKQRKPPALICLRLRLYPVVQEYLNIKVINAIRVLVNARM